MSIVKDEAGVFNPGISAGVGKNSTGKNPNHPLPFFEAQTGTLLAAYRTDGNPAKSSKTSRVLSYLTHCGIPPFPSVPPSQSTDCSEEFYPALNGTPFETNVALTHSHCHTHNHLTAVYQRPSRKGDDQGKQWRGQVRNFNGMLCLKVLRILFAPMVKGHRDGRPAT